MNTHNGQNARAAIFGAALVASGAWLFVRLADFVHDDAFISLRYAYHLARYGEMAWNLGEVAEGYTNPLHIFISAWVIALGADPLAAAQGLNAVGYAALVGFGWLLTGEATRAPSLRVAAMAPLVAAPPIAWVYGGLEATPVAASLAAALLCVMRTATGGVVWALTASAAFAIAYLFRPDAALAAFFAGAALLFFARRPLRERLGLFIATGLLIGLVVALHVGLRLAYYGEVLPLTFYAKVDIDGWGRLRAGLLYLLRAGASVPLFWALGALLLMMFWLRRAPPFACRLGLVLIAGHLGYLLLSGGDHMRHFRQIVPILPALTLALAGAMAGLPRRPAQWAAIGLTAIAVLSAAATPGGRPNSVAVTGAVAGLHLNETLPKGAVVATSTAGSTPYFAPDLNFIDTLGLNDPIIAKRSPVPIRSPRQHRPGHAKGDGAYVLTREPDVIILGAGRGRTAEEAAAWFLTDIELIESEGFHRCYRMRREAVEAARYRQWPARAHQGPYSFVSYRRICPKEARKPAPLADSLAGDD